jgi:hypothetical protein
MIFDVHRVIIAPAPYMGQKGPRKKPLFVSLPANILEYVTSKIQPKKEYKEKNNTRFVNSANAWVPPFRKLK